MTRDVDPFMLQTLQATLVSYVDSANRQRPQREEALRQYIKQVQPQDEALARDDEETLVWLLGLFYFNKCHFVAGLKKKYIYIYIHIK